MGKYLVGQIFSHIFVLSFTTKTIIMNIKVSEIRKFEVNNEIREGVVQGYHKDNSFIVIVKNVETDEDQDFIVHESEFVMD
jgi:hypothetical protein